MTFRFCELGTVAVVAALVVLGAACASDPERTPTVVNLGSLREPPPPDMATIVAQARSVGGIAFVGEITGDLAPAPPGLVVLGDQRVEFGREMAQVTVLDGLGDTTAASIPIIGGDGMPPILTDADGVPIADVVISGLYPDEPWRRLLPGLSLFVAKHYDGGARAEDWNLVWRADIVDDNASGEGTMSGNGVSIESLRPM